MWVQASGLLLTAATRDFGWWIAGSVLLGVGTAMVYPSLIAAVSDASHPTWRARSLSVYRFWRDLGYAVGALSAGVIADLFGLSVGDRVDRGADVRIWRHRRFRTAGFEPSSPSAVPTPGRADERRMSAYAMMGSPSAAGRIQ